MSDELLLQIHLSEIEKAEFLNCMSFYDPGLGLALRRLFWELDAAKAINVDLLAACKDMLSEIADKECIGVDEFIAESGKGTRWGAAIAKAEAVK